MIGWVRAVAIAAAAVCACEPEPTPARVSRAASLDAHRSIDAPALSRLLGVPPESLGAAGRERYVRQEYDSARLIWRVEVERAHAAADIAGEARTRMWLGLAAWRLGDYKTARREGEASLVMKRRLGLDLELSRSFNALGLLAWNEGRQHDALVDFDSAVASARRHGDAAGVARAAANIPLVQVELGDFDAARASQRNALDAARTIGDDRTIGNVLANSAMLDVRLGAPSLALPLLIEARRHYAAIAYATGQSNALAQLATAWAELGDLQRAIGAADSSLAIARAEGLRQQVAADLEVLADLHVQAGSSRLAMANLLEGDSLDAALGLAVERGSDLRRLAAILLNLGEIPASVSRARQALAVHLAARAAAEAVYDRLQLAESRGAGGALGVARVEADSAFAEALRLGNRPAVRAAAAARARLALDVHDPRAALADVRLAERAGSETDWRLADLRGEALMALGSLDDARRAEERAITALERERASLNAGPLRSAFLGSRVAPYERLVAIHLALGDTADAFQVAASLPGREMAERLGGMVDAPLAVQSLASGEQLLLRAEALDRQVAQLDTGRAVVEQRASLERRLDATRASYEEYLAHRASSPDATALGTTSIDVAEIRSRLGRHDVLLLALAGPHRLQLFFVGRAAVLARTVSLDDRSLADRVRTTRELMRSDGQSTEALAALGDLYDMLIGSALALPPFASSTRLLIVPHASLGALPFGALWDRRRGRYLAEERVVTYLPAAGALSSSSRVGDLRLHDLSVFAPLPDSLPGSAHEALAVARRVPGSRLLIGANSTEASVRRALASGSPIHIASHGGYDPESPLFSNIVVGRARGGDLANDGRLEAREVLALRTRSPLVFLSGCETGLPVADGPFAAGADEGSLAQAFLVAGAANVVATFWRVDDAAAAGFAASFYEALGRGSRPADALSAAQRDAIRHRRGGFTWSAFAVWAGSAQTGAMLP